jgi:hypothetical protein
MIEIAQKEEEQNKQEYVITMGYDTGMVTAECWVTCSWEVTSWELIRKRQLHRCRRTFAAFCLRDWPSAHWHLVAPETVVAMTPTLGPSV